MPATLTDTGLVQNVTLTTLTTLRWRQRHIANQALVIPTFHEIFFTFFTVLVCLLFLMAFGHFKD